MTRYTHKYGSSYKLSCGDGLQIVETLLNYLLNANLRTFKYVVSAVESGSRAISCAKAVLMQYQGRRKLDNCGGGG